LSSEETQWITLAEAARRCGHSPVTLRQAVQRGRLKAKREGDGNRATLHTTQADLEMYLTRRRTWRGYGQHGTGLEADKCRGMG
jgi:hypothetical protein